MPAQSEVWWVGWLFGQVLDVVSSFRFFPPPPPLLETFGFEGLFGVTV